ncbi:MAG: hypothetical protein JRG95_21525, partial [Deltaproteobacteria bacterium]|nr:hypothetical protein [Deltaproteobacteria bacterium]
RGLTVHGYSLHDENVRVPLIMLHASLPATRIAQQVRTIDLAPTIVELLGVEAPERWIGESLLPLLRGESSADRIAFSEHNLGKRRYSLRSSDEKLVSNPYTGAERYFDMRLDPGEMWNLVGDTESSERVTRASAELESWRRATRARAAVRKKVSTLAPALARQLELLGYAEGAEEQAVEPESGDGH